ncbi:hypothetical protein [Paenarthrobacter nicotinovorans]|uniref:hypothetical protein n=1 Tax=Paenarthrobacter nicotinovorans TaxID=29320 RepID=UPI0004BADBC5|nr:hypothetical protein [Paenarthrobacter nicotinovorans]
MATAGDGARLAGFFGIQASWNPTLTVTGVESLNPALSKSGMLKKRRDRTAVKAATAGDACALTADTCPASPI